MLVNLDRCGHKKVRLTRFTNDCFEVGITRFFNDDLVSDEADFCTRKKRFLVK
jgi:hypothetical protein